MATFMRSEFFLLAGTALLAGLIHAQQTESPTQTPAPGAAPAPQATPQTQTPAEQKPKPAPVYEPATVLKVKTRLVVVDVVVMDHKGVPVADLKTEDFNLMEDGKEQKIRAFSFQHPTQEKTGTPLDPSSQLPPNVVTNVPRYRVNSALNVLLLDGLNTKLTDQKYARELMIKFLQKLPANQPLAIYALGSKLRLLQDFTTDPALLRNAINTLKQGGSPLKNDASGVGTPYYAPGMLEQMPAQMQEQVKQFEQDNTAFQTDVRVHLTLDALNSLARALSGYPGRKNLIWLSEVFPFNIIPNPNAGGRDQSATSMRDYSGDVARTANILTDAQVAVYPVDARGLGGITSYNVASNTDNSGNYLGRTARLGGMGGELNRESDDLLAAHSTMNDLADRTGGKAFYNRNDLDTAVQSSIDDGSTYYTLAYYPENKDWDGKFRKISVKTNRSGVKLRYRLGYFSTDPQTYSTLDPKLRAKEFGEALNLDFPTSTTLRFQAAIFPPSEKTGNKVHIHYAVDAHAISFESRDDGLQHATLDCAVEVYSNAGKSIKVDSNTMNAALQPDAFKQLLQTAFPCTESFDLPAGTYVLRLGVRDGRTGLIGTATGTVTVAALPTPVDTAKPEEKKP